MKKGAEEKKTASAKSSIEKLKAMSNEEYTKQLAQDMADALNAARKRRSSTKQSKTDKNR